MKRQFQSKAVPRGTRTLWRYLSALIILFTFAIGNVWAADPIENEGDYSTQVISADGKTSTWTFIQPGSQVTVPTAGATDNDVVYSPSGSSKQKFSSSNAFSWSGTSSCYFPVPSGSAGTISMTVKSSSDSRYLQLYVAGSAAADSKRLWSKYNATPTSDGKKGPQSFSFTADDITTVGTKTYLHFKDNNTEMKIASISVTLTTGTYITPDCDEPATALSLSSDAAATVYVGDEITFSTTGGNGGSVTIAGSASETISDGKWIATEGEHTFTASQAKNGNVCAQEDDLVLTVNPKTPVTSVSVAGDDAGYLNDEVTFTATAEYAASYRWTIDGVAQSSTTATMSFTPTVAGEYSIVCEARNDFNDPGDWIASTAHTYIASKLCGELIKIVQNGQSDGTVSGILTGTKDVKLSSGTSEYDEKTGRKIGSDNYWLGVTNLSKPLRAGDVATVFVTTASAKLQLFSDKGTTLIGEMESGVEQGENEIVLNSSATGKTAIYLYRTSTAGSAMNPYVHSLSVSRSCTPSADCSISGVTINSESVTPVSKVYSYEVPAASALTEVAVAYTIHPLATASPASGFKVAVPDAGNPANTQTITVTAEDGTHSDTYTISVSRAASLSDDATLTALSVTGYTLDPVFAAATEDYTITKAYGAEDPAADKVSATPATGASADIQWDGTNKKFVITVTAEDGVTEKTYNITVNEAEAPKSLSRVLFSNGFDAFIDNTNHTVKAYYLAGTSAPTATTITAGAGTAGEYAEGKITVTGVDDSTVDYTVTLAEVTPNTTTVAEADPAGEFAGDEAWVKNGLLVYGNAAGYSAGDKWYVNRRLTKSGDAADDQRVIAGWVRSYFFVGNASKFIMTVGGNKKLKYSVDGGEAVAVEPTTLEITLTAGNHMIEIVSNQSSGDCRLSAPKLVELPPTFTVNYYPGDGSGDVVVDLEATVVADCPAGFTAPEGKIFHGWKDGDNNDVAVGDPVTASMALTAQWIGHYAVTFNMQDHGTAIVAQDIVAGNKAVKPTDPSEIGYDFGGWFTDAECTAGNEWDFDNDVVSAATELFAKWTAFDGCAILVPALSGDAPTAKNQAIDLQSGSFGGAIKTAGAKDNKWSESFAYTANGFGLQKGGADSLRVELSNDMKVGTVIKVKFYAADASSRGLYLKNLSKTTKMEMTQTEVGAKEYTYTVEEGDGLAGTNAFLLSRNNTVYLQSVTVSNCGDAIVYHNLTSAVNIAGKGVVTLGATSVREGHSTTATYSDIDPLYEFVNWTVSGEGASLDDATANPVNVTMGTEDAVVTLNLQLIPVKFTVNYYDGETPMGTEEVAVNENPTASEIDTDKRHYTFQGWAETDGGSVVALNTITSDVAATINMYAVYAPVACPTEGTVFSMEFDPEKAPESTVKVAKNGGSIDLADYATISGGAAVIVNTETSDKDAISTDGKFLLKATKEVMKIELDCAIATGDVIRIPDNNQKYVLSTSNAKTGTYQAQTSSQHEFEATAAWNGVDDLYVLYDGSSLNFTKVYVLRPYTISFDLQGHGDAIDAQKLVEGKKVAEPTAPTADGWDFGGWYKEAACTNAWDFDNDVVESTMSLFAKWTEHVTNDATLKSLKYGTTDIALVDGIYSYNVELAASVAAVPALSAETNAELATKLITNAEAFEAGQATSTVLVTAEDGATQLTYTVIFTKATAIELQDVTGNMTWDFSKANDGSAATSSMCNDEVLANVAGIVNNSDFKSDNIKATANKFSSNKLQASMIMFHTTVPGAVIVKFANTGSKSDYRYLVVNGVQTEAKSKDATMVTYAEYVPAGDVVLTVTTANEGNMFNFTSVEFKVDNDLEPARTDDWLAPGEMGTICIPQGAVAVGADIYELVGSEPVYGKIVFETVKHMKPGKPYMFISKGDRIDLILTDEAEASEPDNSGAMKGTFVALNLTELENVYYFAQHALWSCVDLTSLSVPANRAYVKLDEVDQIQDPTPAPGRRRVLMNVNGEKNATGIENLNATEKPMKLMINGQIFILRGEKMFDATGRLVK